MYKIVFTKQALKDLANLKQSHLSAKAQSIIHILRENPFQKPPNYEKLVGNLAGAYSRRINIQHRIVYQVYEGTVSIGDVNYSGIVKIIRMWTHYDGTNGIL